MSVPPIQPVDELSVSFNPAPEAARTEKFAMGQVFLSRKPDGTIRRHVVPITIEGPNAQIAEDCRKKLLEKLQTNGKAVSHFNILKRTVRYSDGTDGTLEMNEDVQQLRRIYSEFAEKNKISISWPASSGKSRGDQNGPRLLVPASNRTLAMRGWDQTKIVEQLSLDEPQKKRLGKIDQFLEEVQNSIQEMIDQEPPLPEKRKNNLVRLKAVVANCDRFALIAAACKVTREELENALKSEEGDEFEDGVWGLLRYRKSEPTEKERAYLEDISLLNVEDTAELAVEYEKLGRSVPQDCFERVLLQALNQKTLEEAVKVFSEHPLIQGLVSSLAVADRNALGDKLTEAFKSALAPPPSLDDLD